jgi:translation initiation factor 5A
MSESDIYPIQASSLRKGGYMLIKDRPCKIVDMSTSKTGKHGHAKVHFVATDIFTGKKLEDMAPSTHNVNVPNVKRTEYQVIDMDDEYVSIMEESGETKEIKMPTDLDMLDKMKKCMANEDKMFFITVLTAMGEEAVVEAKNT